MAIDALDVGGTMPVYHGDPDLIWVQEAIAFYEKSRGTLDKLVARGVLTLVTFEADKKHYLRRSELDRVFGHPTSGGQGE